MKNSTHSSRTPNKNSKLSQKNKKNKALNKSLQNSFISVNNTTVYQNEKVSINKSNFSNENFIKPGNNITLKNSIDDTHSILNKHDDTHSILNKHEDPQKDLFDTYNKENSVGIQKENSVTVCRENSVKEYREKPTVKYRESSVITYKENSTSKYRENSISRYRLNSVRSISNEKGYDLDFDFNRNNVIQTQDNIKKNLDACEIIPQLSKESQALLDLIKNNFDNVEAAQKNTLKNQFQNAKQNVMRDYLVDEGTQTLCGEIDPKEIEYQITKSTMMNTICQFMYPSNRKDASSQTDVNDFRRLCRYEEVLDQKRIDDLDKEDDYEPTIQDNYLFGEMTRQFEKMQVLDVLDTAVRDYEDYSHKVGYFDVFDIKDLEMIIFCILDEKCKIHNNLFRLKKYQELILLHHQRLLSWSERVSRFLDRAAIHYKGILNKSPELVTLREARYNLAIQKLARQEAGNVITNKNVIKLAPISSQKTVMENILKGGIDNKLQAFNQYMNQRSTKHISKENNSEKKMPVKSKFNLEKNESNTTFQSNLGDSNLLHKNLKNKQSRKNFPETIQDDAGTIPFANTDAYDTKNEQGLDNSSNGLQQLSNYRSSNLKINKEKDIENNALDTSLLLKNRQNSPQKLINKSNLSGRKNQNKSLYDPDELGLGYSSYKNIDGNIFSNENSDSQKYNYYEDKKRRNKSQNVSNRKGSDPPDCANQNKRDQQRLILDHIATTNDNYGVIGKSQECKRNPNSVEANNLIQIGYSPETGFENYKMVKENNQLFLKNGNLVEHKIFYTLQKNPEDFSTTYNQSFGHDNDKDLSENIMRSPLTNAKVAEIQNSQNVMNNYQSNLVPNLDLKKSMIHSNQLESKKHGSNSVTFDFVQQEGVRTSSCNAYNNLFKTKARQKVVQNVMLRKKNDMAIKDNTLLDYSLYENCLASNAKPKKFSLEKDDSFGMNYLGSKDQLKADIIPDTSRVHYNTAREWLGKKPIIFNKKNVEIEKKIIETFTMPKNSKKSKEPKKGNIGKNKKNDSGWVFEIKGLEKREKSERCLVSSAKTENKSFLDLHKKELGTDINDLKLSPNLEINTRYANTSYKIGLKTDKAPRKNLSKTVRTKSNASDPFTLMHELDSLHKRLSSYDKAKETIKKNTDLPSMQNKSINCSNFGPVSFNININNYGDKDFKL